MPSYLIIAQVMSFLDYQDGVERLMRMLSKKTRSHYKRHSDILKEFLVPWKPYIQARLEFGNSDALMTLPHQFVDFSGKYLSKFPSPLILTDFTGNNFPWNNLFPTKQ